MGMSSNWGRRLFFILLSQLITHTGCSFNNSKVSLLEHIETSGLIVQRIQLEEDKQLIVYVTNPDFHWVGELYGGGILPNSIKIYGDFTLYLKDKSNVISALDIGNMVFYSQDTIEELGNRDDFKVIEMKNWNVEGIKYCLAFEQYANSSNVYRCIVGYSIRDKKLKTLLPPTFVSFYESTTFEKGRLYAEYYDNSTEGGYFIDTYVWNPEIEVFEKVSTTRK